MILAPKFIQIQVIPMKDAIVVSITGFQNDPREQEYKELISNLGWRLAPHLSEETSVLIVNDVSSEKYKIAKTYDTPISCVSIDWLLDCHKKKKLLSTAPYQIKKLFFGVSIIILGFQAQKSKCLAQKLNENGGKCRIIADNKELSSLASSEERVSVIITTKENFQKLKHYLDCFLVPIVGLEWVECSFQANVVKYPQDYAFNLTRIAVKEAAQHYPKMKKKLEIQLSSPPLEKFQAKVLENTFIYIGPNVNTDLSSLLKRLVMMYGGFYLDDLCPVVTHILTEPVTEQEYSELKLYGVLVHLLRVQWLIDSIYLHKRMREEDYVIRSFKTKGSSSHLQDKQNMMLNSMSMHSFGFGMSVPTLLNNRKSISMSVQPAQKMKHAKEVKVFKKTDSNIFKGYRFYIESTQKKEIELSDLTAKIIRNSGEVFNSRADMKQGHCFYVIKDSLDNNALIERLKSDTRMRVQLQPISYRWVNQCLAKGQFIDINKTESYIYKPFNFKTPILGFHKMVFEVLGVDDVSKLRLKELYNHLGSAKNMANKSQITHCLCGNNYKETNRYKELSKENANVQYINWRWLIECANSGKIVDVEGFLMDKQGSGSQETENTNTLNLIIPVGEVA